MNVQRGKGWELVLVERLSVRLSCGHLALVPRGWVMPDGRLSCGLECSQGLCRRVTYDVVLQDWEAQHG